MNKPKITKILGGLVIVVGLMFSGWLIGVGGNVNLNPVTDLVVEQVTPKTVSVMFDFGDGTVKTFTDIEIKKDKITLAEVLSVLYMEDKIDLDYTDYGGDLGIFIQAIDSVPGEGASDKWWQFWVNNVYSTSGVSSYYLNSGDVIEFKFTKGQ
ncbi:MAG: DUF4430 domain-containing protein [Candidatus Uhrbacteria bacterium]